MSNNIGLINNSGSSAGFFGKLPNYPDFIKFNAGGNEIIEIDNWIQSGLALAKTQLKDKWRDSYNNLSKLNFIYPFTGTENFIYGVILSSEDKSGRSYPFILFNNIQQKFTFEKPYHLIPAALQNLFISINKLSDINMFCNDLTILQSSVKKIKSTLLEIKKIDDDYHQFISETTVKDITSLEDESSIELFQIFQDRLSILDHLVMFSFRTTITEQNDLFLICFYTQLLQKLLKKSNSTPALFWIKKDDNSYILSLSFIKPTAKDFLDLILYENIILSITEDRTDQILKNSISLNTFFSDNPVINKNIRLSEFINSLDNFLN